MYTVAFQEPIDTFRVVTPVCNDQLRVLTAREFGVEEFVAPGVGLASRVASWIDVADPVGVVQPDRLGGTGVSCRIDDLVEAVVKRGPKLVVARHDHNDIERRLDRREGLQDVQRDRLGSARPHGQRPTRCRLQAMPKSRERTFRPVGLDSQQSGVTDEQHRRRHLLVAGDEPRRRDWGRFRRLLNVRRWWDGCRGR